MFFRDGIDEARQGAPNWSVIKAANELAIDVFGDIYELVCEHSHHDWNNHGVEPFTLVFEQNDGDLALRFVDKFEKHESSVSTKIYSHLRYAVWRAEIRELPGFFSPDATAFLHVFGNALKSLCEDTLGKKTTKVNFFDKEDGVRIVVKLKL